MRAELAESLKSILTPSQLAHLPSVEWLFNPKNAREGRITVMAIMFIDQALRNPGQEVQLADHFLDYDGIRSSIMMEVIEDMLRTHCGLLAAQMMSKSKEVHISVDALMERFVFTRHGKVYSLTYRE